MLLPCYRDEGGKTCASPKPSPAWTYSFRLGLKMSRITAADAPVRTPWATPPGVSQKSPARTAILDADALPFQKDSPLLLGMAVDGAAGVRLDADHREHGVLPGEDPRPDALRQLAGYARALVVKVEDPASVGRIAWHESSSGDVTSW
jgi:hypothetical protein